MSRFEQDWNALEIADAPDNQQKRLVKQVKQGNVDCVYPMIIKIATESWLRLPPHTRTWYTKEEYIAAGVAFAVVEAAKDYDSKRNNKKTGDTVKFSSFLYERLTQFYITKESEPLRAEKRWEGSLISYENEFVKTRDGRAFSVEFYIAHTTKLPSPEDEVISRIDAQKHFLKVYDAASTTLRKYLLKWFLSSKVIRMKEGSEYNAAKRELRKTASLYGFTFDMAILLACNDAARADTIIKLADHCLRNKQMFAAKEKQYA